MIGIDDAITAVSGLFKTTLDKWIPDANAKLALQQAHDAETAAAAQAIQTATAAESAAEIDLLKKQIDVNLAQASNSNIFVSGPRPFAMWALTICIILLSGWILYLVQQGKGFGEYFSIYSTLVAFDMALFGVHSFERQRGMAPEQPDGPNVPAPSSVAGKIPRA